MKVIIAYIPILHEGYLAFLGRHQPADFVLLSSDSLKSVDEVIADRLSRDIRCLPVDDIIFYLKQKFPDSLIREYDGLESLLKYKDVVMLDEDVSYVLDKQLPWAEIKFDNYFLRWDWSKTNVAKSVTDAGFPVSTDEKHRFFMATATLQAGGSSDPWRQVGAVLPYNEKDALTAFNKHMPGKDAPYVWGDPRLHMKPGEKPEICLAIHAEALLISTAARKGISIEGKEIFVTTFPCPVCARMIVESGIKKVFFKEGYSNLDAAEILSKGEVDIVQVK